MQIFDAQHITLTNITQNFDKSFLSQQVSQVLSADQSGHHFNSPLPVHKNSSNTAINVKSVYASLTIKEKAAEKLRQGFLIQIYQI